MFSLFETVAAAVKVVSAAEPEHAPTNEGKGEPAPYCIIA
ncbi:putative mating factor a2.1 [Ustilago hordei]|uniref:Pheromone Mfa2 n=1 Tax=Ustilago hordei TaxID=120017 RepID=Q9UV53_USTHO|nr:putative mating factor a2.1 [Ustilago hordei]AAD56043.1 pheromone Mfa2 [Ustilago hordei]SYW81864.1 probable mating factor a2.1 [Ustilago hordei]